MKVLNNELVKMLLKRDEKLLDIKIELAGHNRIQIDYSTEDYRNAVKLLDRIYDIAFDLK